jgi:hypothetical protein
MCAGGLEREGIRKGVCLRVCHNRLWGAHAAGVHKYFCGVITYIHTHMCMCNPSSIVGCFSHGARPLLELVSSFGLTAV